MIWLSVSASTFGDCEIKCSVCHEKQVGQDVVYQPRFTDDEQDEKRAEQIEMLFGVDPFTEFVVCENCMEGHCGTVPGKTANKWLEKRARFKEPKP